MTIGKSIVFDMENQKMKVKTPKNIRFWLKCGSYHSKKNQKVFKLVRGCQAITEKVQMQLCQNFAVTRGILLQSQLVSFILDFNVVLVL